MKRTSVFKTAVAAALFAVMVAGAASAAAVKAKLTSVKGDVQTRASASASWQGAKTGDTIAEGAQIKCGPGAEAVVGWGKGNVLKVSALSSVTFTGLSADGSSSNSKMTLESGKVFAKSGKLTKGSAFEVRTPTAVAGVRGTGFEATPSSFSVVEGTVAVSAGGQEIEVGAGMMVEVPEIGEIPEPAPIPAETLTELEQTNQEMTEISVQVESESESVSPSGESGEKSEEEATSESNTTDESTDVDTEAILDNAQMNDLVDEATQAGECPECGSISGTIEF